MIQAVYLQIIFLNVRFGCLLIFGNFFFGIFARFFFDYISCEYVLLLIIAGNKFVKLREPQLESADWKQWTEDICWTITSVNGFEDLAKLRILSKASVLLNA